MFGFPPDAAASGEQRLYGNFVVFRWRNVMAGLTCELKA
jgi:hypothetical protein